MSKTIKDHLYEIFLDLTNDQFKLFKSKLCDRKQEPRIRKGAVENADRLDLVEKLISAHTEKRAVAVTIEVLKSINCNDLASELASQLASELADNERELGSASANGAGCRAAGGGAATPAAGPGNMVGGRHFIDFHQVSLINRVSNVAGILDQLRDRGITSEEQYEEIGAEPTRQGKMRKIFHGPINSGGQRAKDALYEILESLERYLMDDLK
ncbi:hypothetical protein AAFF_G00204700 [Aldrovandia affinis]|uniref:Apoptosis-associated speck-like protein containing a CARD n=1 Tax=Aldrovandia affinis TaxID=143900 RepID=A0AAD7W6B6_9TELE|nr:hypothetical protein AAFF_G00204700 [Aldrovandia affinis]